MCKFVPVSATFVIVNWQTMRKLKFLSNTHNLCLLYSWGHILLPIPRVNVSKTIRIAMKSFFVVFEYKLQIQFWHVLTSVSLGLFFFICLRTFVLVKHCLRADSILKPCMHPLCLDHTSRARWGLYKGKGLRNPNVFGSCAWKILAET